MGDLQRRQLGRTGLEVSVIGLGAMELRGGPGAPAVSDDEAGRLLAAAVDGGINLVDTSIDYGRSEELIGRYLGHRRSELVLASKCGCVPGAGMGAEHLHTAANVRAGVERSLQLLRTDYLDLVQFHRSLRREEFDEEGALSELYALQEEGKVRYLGVSGVLPTLVEQLDMGVFDVFQIPYSALQRDHEDVIAAASATGAGIIVRGGLARATPEDWVGRSYYMIPTELLRQRWSAAGLDELAGGMRPVELLLRFALSHPDVDTTLVGTSRLDHLRADLDAAARGPLPDDLYHSMKWRLDQADRGQRRPGERPRTWPDVTT